MVGWSSSCSCMQSQKLSVSISKFTCCCLRPKPLKVISNTLRCAYFISVEPQVNEIIRWYWHNHSSFPSFIHYHLGFQILSLFSLSLSCAYAETNTWMPLSGKHQHDKLHLYFFDSINPLSFAVPLSLHPFCLSYFTSLPLPLHCILLLLSFSLCLFSPPLSIYLYVLLETLFQPKRPKGVASLQYTKSKRKTKTKQLALCVCVSFSQCLQLLPPGGVQHQSNLWS